MKRYSLEQTMQIGQFFESMGKEKLSGMTVEQINEEMGRQLGITMVRATLMRWLNRGGYSFYEQKGPLGPRSGKANNYSQGRLYGFEEGARWAAVEYARAAVARCLDVFADASNLGMNEFREKYRLPQMGMMAAVRSAAEDSVGDLLSTVDDRLSARMAD